MILDPVAAYVLKTLNVADGSKVFINVCTDPQIEPPETLDASEVAMQVMKGKDWIVPIVVSSGRSSKDKAGQPCFVVDCCMNPSVVLLGIEDPSVKVLTVETCIELVEDRFGNQLSRDYKFPRMKSKGPLEKFEVTENTVSRTSSGGTDVSEAGITTGINTGTNANEFLKNHENDPIPKEDPQITIKTSDRSNRAVKIEVLDSENPASRMYFHLYRGPYSGSRNSKPSHVIEIEDETHDIRLNGSMIVCGAETLDVKFVPSHVDAFYCADENVTYVMLWR